MKILQIFKRKSYLSGFLIGAGKIVMAAGSRSWLLFIHAIYNIIKTSALHCANQEGQDHHRTMFLSGLFVIVASTVYLTYSVYIFFLGSTAIYHMYVAIGVAAITTYELIVTIHGLRKAKKAGNIHQETLNYINLSSALISVSLAQTAILSFTNRGVDMSQAYAAGDALFGLLALLVGIMMLIRANQLDKT